MISRLTLDPNTWAIPKQHSGLSIHYSRWTLLTGSRKQKEQRKTGKDTKNVNEIGSSDQRRVRSGYLTALAYKVRSRLAAEIR